MQPVVVVIDEYTCRYMHGIDEYHAFPDSALIQALFNLAGNIDIIPAMQCLDPEFLAV